VSAPALFFDFGGTLDSNGVPWLDRFYPLYLEQGIRLPREEFARAFYASDDNLPARFPLRGLVLDETLRLQVRCILESIAPKRADAADAIVARFLAPSREHLRRNQALLRRLRRNYSLGIISNFYGNLESVLEGEGLLELFDVVADSTAVGCSKPEPELFLYALKQMRISPQEGWMVGDSLPRDMWGAHQLGMPHAWLRGELNQPKGPPCCPQMRILPSLEALETCLQIPWAVAATTT